MALSATPAAADRRAACPRRCSHLLLLGASSPCGLGVGRREREDVSPGKWKTRPVWLACCLNCRCHSWSAGLPFLPGLTSRPPSCSLASGPLSSCPLSTQRPRTPRAPTPCHGKPTGPYSCPPRKQEEGRAGLPSHHATALFPLDRPSGQVRKLPRLTSNLTGRYQAPLLSEAPYLNSYFSWSPCPWPSREEGREEPRVVNRNTPKRTATHLPHVTRPHFQY